MQQLENSTNNAMSEELWLQELGNVLDEHASKRYADAFSTGYKESFLPATAVKDIALIQQLSEENTIAVHLYHDEGDESDILRFRVIHEGAPIALSDMLPILEKFGLRVIGEHPYQINAVASEKIWLHVFELQLGESLNISSDGNDIAEIAPAFELAVQKVWQGKAESDLFNQLVLSGKTDWRTVVMLRGYAHYMKQISLPYTRPYIAKTLAKYSTITNAITELFMLRFDPATGSEAQQREVEAQVIVSQIVESLSVVENLTEDQIIRQYITLVQATLRTNFYQASINGENRDYLSFKFDVNQIPDAPKPRPMYEIFVYSPQIEGVHLRGGKVARGGLRWSDRHEDFRTEVLGLVKAQQVKNSVIVPMGAKGGFVCKKAPAPGDREAFLAEGIACYRIFISALLEITDNLIDGSVIPPESVVRWDGDDPYLVVAADKGTATFSDIANEISQAHNFWLGDAFASGGSVGYDHKKMGITAKGAWVSVQRHFKEIGIDIQQQDFSVVAVGDMAGDVFGNGMLCSEHTCLVAAFNHMHIFIDPTPNSAASFVERERLFNTPGCSWDDYNRDLISAGGGIFSRHAKSIELSEPIKQRFAIESNEVTPNEFIRAILKAEVDLFWNGGIGTYMKASTETHTDVGDRANDALRLNACEMGAKVIGEGGNLGCTQLGRVEYALNGGRCNTDFIDNAGGVDCSDHEVNIKILLDQVMRDGQLGVEERNDYLYSMTDAVSDLVLHNNYRQSQAISLVEAEAGSRSIEYLRLLRDFEAEGVLDRELEFLPNEDALHERKSFGKALTRPELSVLVSYAKLSLKQSLEKSNIADDSYLANSAYGAFPAKLGDEYKHSVDSHQLHNEIVATQLASDLVNRMGITFVHRMKQATGESEAAIVKAYVASRDLFNIEAQWQAIEALDYKVSADLQNELFFALIRLVRRSTRRLLRDYRSQLDISTVLSTFKSTAEFMNGQVETLLHGEQLESWQAKVDDYAAAGVPAEQARFIASSRYFYTTFTVASVVAATKAPIDRVATYYAALGERLELNWFADQIVRMKVDNYWQALARESFRDELEHQQAALVQNLVTRSSDQSVDLSLDGWVAQHQTYIDRWQTMTAELRCVAEFDIAMFPVAIRELLDISQASAKAV